MEDTEKVYHRKNNWKSIIHKHTFFPNPQKKDIQWCKFTDYEIRQYNFHFAYEQASYWDKNIIKLIDKAIVDYALSQNEIERWMNHIDARTRIIKYKHNKKNWITAGMYWEIMLFILLWIYFPETSKLVTKIRYRTSLSDEVKWYDWAHYEIDKDWNIILWLGEAKFYSNFDNWLNEALNSVKNLTTTQLLKQEFVFLSTWTEEISNKEIKEKVENILYSWNLSEIQIKIPILITYDSDIMAKHKYHDETFLNELSEDFEKKRDKICKKNWIDIQNQKIDFYFMLLPFKSVKEIKEKLIEKRNSYD